MSETLAASELDHVFICASIGAPEADRLVEFGLTEGNIFHGDLRLERLFLCVRYQAVRSTALRLTAYICAGLVHIRVVA